MVLIFSSIYDKSTFDVIRWLDFYNIQYLFCNEKSYLTYTELIDASDTEEFPETFSLSFCQDHIIKLCDIRIFFLNERCYSMAIMSQNNPDTLVDFRKYDYENPNRSIPFEIPEDLSRKIRTFMNKLDLISGSLDFILNIEGDFIFLEVNPVGQFGMIDSPCNFGLHRKIAEYLTFID